MCTYASYRMLKKDNPGHSPVRESERSGNSALRITFDVEALSQRRNLPRRKVSVEMCPAF